MRLCWQMLKFIVWRLWSIYFDHHLLLKPFIRKRRKQSCTPNNSPKLFLILGRNSRTLQDAFETLTKISFFEKWGANFTEVKVTSLWKTFFSFINSEILYHSIRKNLESELKLRILYINFLSVLSNNLRKNVLS